MRQNRYHPLVFYTGYHQFQAQNPFGYPPLHPCTYTYYIPLFHDGKSTYLQNQEEYGEEKLSEAISQHSPIKPLSPETALSSHKAKLEEMIKSEHQSMNGPQPSAKQVNSNKDSSYTHIQPTVSAKPEESRFVKKNTQSNIVSQIFACFWHSEKNILYLAQIFGSEDKIKVFQNIMGRLKAKSKGKLNRQYLKRLGRSEDWPCSFKQLKTKARGHELISNEEVASAIRRLSFIYLRQMSRTCIMTSKKMNENLWGMHFKKCRQISGFLYDAQLT